MPISKAVLLGMLFTAVFWAMPNIAYAQWLDCNGAGGVVGGTELFYAVKDEADGGQGVCVYRGIEYIFSTVLCDFLEILNATLSKLYCSMQYFLIESLRILMTVYVAVFGFQLLMGTAQLNLRDIVMRLIKMSLVWTFATQASYGIGVMFYAVVAVMSDASGWVVNAIAAFVSVDGCPAIQFVSSDFTSFFFFVDCLVWIVFQGPMALGSAKLLGLLIATMLAYPPLGSLALWWALKTFMTLTRAIISFLMALAATAFLISLSPIFLSFALFRSTSEHFNNWLRYIISYIVQVVLVFAITVMWILIFLQHVSFFEQLSDLIFTFEPIVERNSDSTPQDVWAICPPEFGFDADGKPGAWCADGFWPYSIFKNGDPNDSWSEHAKELQKPSEFILNGEFLYYLFFHLVSLMIITYAFSVILDNTPTISQSIAQPAALPTLLRRFGNDGFGSAGNLLSPLSNRRPLGMGGAGAPVGRAGGKR